MRDIEVSLRRALSNTAERFEPADIAEAERVFVRKRGRRRLFRTGGAGVLAAASVVAVFALAQQEVVNDREQRPQPAGLAVTSRFEVPAEPLAVAAGRSGIWIASRAGDAVTRIDPATGESDHVRIEGAVEVAVAGTSAWAAGADREVMHIDEDLQVTRWRSMRGRVVDMAAVGQGFGSAWVVYSSGCVTELTSARPGCLASPHFHATDVAASERETWILDGDSGDLHQVRAEPGVNRGRGAVDAAAPPVIAPPGRYADLLISTIGGRDVLWASGEGGRLLRLELESGDSSITRMPGDYVDLAEGYGGVWALVGREGSARGDIVRLDLETGEAQGAAVALSGKPSDIAAVESGVWVTLRDASKLVHIERTES